MKYYDCMVNLADVLGGTFDEAFVLFVFAFRLSFVLLGWAIGGVALYDLTKKAAVAVWRKFRH